MNLTEAALATRKYRIFGVGKSWVVLRAETREPVYGACSDEEAQAACDRMNLLAVLEAIREPSGRAEEAGGAVEDGDVRHFCIGECAAGRVWRAMIAALIAEVGNCTFEDKSAIRNGEKEGVTVKKIELTPEERAKISALGQRDDWSDYAALASKAKELADKATPGPWRTANQNSNGASISGAGDIAVTVGFFGTNSSFAIAGYHQISADEAAANAGLASLSPALADAVLALVERVRELEAKCP